MVSGIFVYRHSSVITAMNCEEILHLQVRSTMQFEGWSYCLGDFSVCVGRATLKPKQEFRGFVAEIHYHPLDDITMGSALLKVKLHHM